MKNKAILWCEGDKGKMKPLLGWEIGCHWWRPSVEVWCAVGRPTHNERVGKRQGADESAHSKNLLLRIAMDSV